jgi:hypothetical protein
MCLVVAVLFMLGMVGVVVWHERGRARTDCAAATEDSIAIATILRGESVDVAAHVARRGLTIVEFTADV